jgi:hypothetical protein
VTTVPHIPVLARLDGEWEPAWLVRRSGPWAWVKWTTLGDEDRVRAVDVKEEE